jgi:CP family cyanate transporter-like MFS transporter
LCLAVLGLVAAGAAAKADLKVLMVVVSAGLVLGSLGRALIVEWIAFSAATAVAAACGALATVLIPSLILRWFPERVAQMSSITAAGIIAGTALGSAVTPALAGATGSWRYGLGLWGVLAIVPLVLWLFVPRPSGPEAATQETSALERRMPFGWTAVFFGMHSANGALVIAWLPGLLAQIGISPSSAGLAVGLFSVVGVPSALLLPTLVARQSVAPAWLLPVGSAVSTTLGWIGLTVMPSWYFAWVVLFGVSMAAYPWTLTRIAGQSTDPRDAMWVTARVNLIAYGMAAIAPLLVGALIGAHLEARLIFAIVGATGAGYLVAGWRASRPPVAEADRQDTSSDRRARGTRVRVNEEFERK